MLPRRLLPGEHCLPAHNDVQLMIPYWSATTICTMQMARELARRLAEEKGLLEIDRAAPRADPQDTGLLKGKKE